MDFNHNFTQLTHLSTIFNFRGGMRGGVSFYVSGPLIKSFSLRYKIANFKNIIYGVLSKAATGSIFPISLFFPFFPFF